MKLTNIDTFVEADDTSPFLGAKATRIARLTALSTLLAVCLMVLGFLALEVLHKLDDLRTANTDNAEWNFSQVEVDYLRMQAEFERAALANAANPDDMRQKFDLFFSRFMTVRSGPFAQELIYDPAIKDPVRRVDSFLEQSIETIDGPDDILLARASDMLRDIKDLQSDIRHIALNGLQIFIEEAETNREDISTTLLRLAILATGTIAILIIAVLMLIRLNLTNEARNIERHKTNMRLATVINASLDAIIMADESGNIVQYNAAAQEIFGYSYDEVIGQNLGEKIIPSKFQKAHQAGMDRMKANPDKIRIVGAGRIKLEGMRKDGTHFPLELAVEMVKEQDKNLFVAFIRDITLELAAETELVQARDRALAGEKAKADFLAVMSHEMRTPLNGIVGTLALLQGTDLTEKQQVCLTALRQSAKQLENHVNDVLDISRFEAGKTELNKELIDLGHMIEALIDAHSDMADRQCNEIVVHWHEVTEKTVITDGQKLRQILHNILSNANKFTRAGHIRVEIETVQETPQNMVVEFRIFDTGIGIAEEYLERIFNDFESLNADYSRTTEGAGLGLGIARRMVKALGGKIGVESTQGKGSLFWVRIPIEASTLQWTSDQQKPSSETTVTEPMNILMVEDNDINRFVLREMLVSEGHTVDEAENGSQGVEMANAKKYDVILMDISMPVMDGITATKLIRDGQGKSVNTPVVAATANAMPEEIDHFKSIGVNDILRKPIEKSHLLAKLSALGLHRHNMKHNGETIMAQELIDIDRITTMKEQFGADTMTSLLSRLKDEADTVVTTLTGPEAKTKEVTELVAQMHKVAGSAASLGLNGLQRQLNIMEDFGKQGDHDRLWDEVATLKSVWDSSKATLTQHGVL